jgi:hypothetical protein
MEKRYIFIITIIIVITYSLGIVTSHYQLLPVRLIKTFKKTIQGIGDSVDNSTLSQHFSGKLSTRDKLLYPKISSLEQLTNRVNSWVVNIDTIENVYSNIELIHSSFHLNTFSLIYSWNNKRDTVHAYYRQTNKDTNRNVGISIIPGSGNNQSSAMYYDEKNNYQSNIDNIAQTYGDIFILIKANEDFLAIHNGDNKIEEKSYVNYLINKGGSYTSYTLMQGLALSKYVKSKYDEYFICGLSQGGKMALIIALQSNPQKAVIASGYSILMDNVYLSGHNQLIIPNISNVYNPVRIKDYIYKSNTQFLFTFGAEESGIYGEEVQKGLTSKFFTGLLNVKVVNTPEGHVYYEPEISRWLANSP